MRGSASTSEQHRASSCTARPRLAILALAAFVVVSLPAAPAYAGLYHPQPPVASFGPLGGACAEGDLATGIGDLASGSKEITSVTATCGTFEVGQEVRGTGLSATITAVGAGTLTVSSAASASGSGVALTTSSRFANSGVDHQLAFSRAPRRLYAVENSHKELIGFDLSTPGAYTPLTAPFPLSIPIFLSFSGTSLAVDDSDGPTQGNVYTAAPDGEDVILGYDSTGAPLPGFPIVSPPEPLGEGGNGWDALAVDPNGNIWGGNYRNREDVAYEYSPAGVLLNTVRLPGTRPSDLYSLAFTANGDLYVDSEGSVWKLSAPAYDHAQLFVQGVIGLLDVDRASGDLYVASVNTGLPNGNRVLRYRSDGALLEEFATGLSEIQDVALDEASGAALVSTGNRGGFDSKVYVFDALVLPDLTIALPSDPTATTVTLNGTVDPAGEALTACKFEWVTEAAYQATGFASLASGGEQACSPALGSIPASEQTGVSATITGLAPGETYRYRLSASNANGTNTTKGVAGSFALAQPEVETVGSPIRSATTARLDSRVDPHGIATTYHFEYLTEADYQANLAASQPPFTGALATETHSAGSGALIELVSQHIEGLNPATTYRYRVVADNGAFGGPAMGEAMTLTTRASDAPLSHGRYPGPSGSDRAWEQVNSPDTGGNPVSGAAGIAANGDSAVYQVTGGTPLSEAGTFEDYLFAHRPPAEHPTSGWQTEAVFPPRADTAFSGWRPPTGDDALSTLLALNIDLASDSGASVWRLPTAGGAPAKLYEAPPRAYSGPYFFSDDGSRALLVLEGKHVDLAHESPSGVIQLYDVSSGTPTIASLLPGNTVPSCGLENGSGGDLFSNTAHNEVPRSTHLVSADGSRAFFSTDGEEPCGAPHLYMRDFAEGETLRLDGPPLAGPECSGALIRSTPQAVYVWTQADLAAPDTPIAGSCASGKSGPGGDVYRYDLASHDFECLTCVVPGGLPANVYGGQGSEGTHSAIAVATNGPRLYFTTTTRLLPGAPETGVPAIYRVDTETHQLAYVAPLEPGDNVGENPSGEFDHEGTAISPDGRFLVFRSADPALDALTGSDNGHTAQDYIYDDLERSLSCVSCPPDGAAPRAAAAKGIHNAIAAPNMTSLADNGDFAFATPTPLVAADQNTAPAGQSPLAGTDVYEWRDGRALLVSDGLTDWPNEAAVPEVDAISPSGRDLFFTEAAQLTPDALDGYKRLYDARIGGGIDFPVPPKPCPLEVCQGASKGAPEEAEPGSVFFSGPGNLAPPSLTATVPVQPKAKALTRAQLLARALRACKRKPRRERAGCAAQARRRYGPKKAGKATNDRRTPR